jgi:hypothetical protein
MPARPLLDEFPQLSLADFHGESSGGFGLIVAKSGAMLPTVDAVDRGMGVKVLAIEPSAVYQRDVRGSLGGLLNLRRPDQRRKCEEDRGVQSHAYFCWH